jgi:hypothetical protein
MPPVLVDALMARRSELRVVRYQSAEHVVGVLGLDPTIPEIRAMVQHLSFADRRAIVRSTGFVDIGRAVVSYEIVATVELTGDEIRVVKVEVQ